MFYGELDTCIIFFIKMNKTSNEDLYKDTVIIILILLSCLFAAQSGQYFSYSPFGRIGWLVVAKPQGIMVKLALCKISNFWLVSVAELASFGLTWSHSRMTDFVVPLALISIHNTYFYILGNNFKHKIVNILLIVSFQFVFGHLKEH